MYKSPVTCFYEHGDEPWGFIKSGDVLDQLGDYQLLEKTVPWNSLYRLMRTGKVKLSLCLSTTP